ncbi:MAG: hypothetical protein M3483_00175 [Gemmatimonadota bacterium]|nr:hypothetical protein [Gemmatimonadota bacterium]
MINDDAPADRHSLADVDSGDEVEIRHVIFGTLRRGYARAGLRAGMRATVRERSVEWISLMLADGRETVVDVRHAAFFEVRLLFRADCAEVPLFAERPPHVSPFHASQA